MAATFACVVRMPGAATPASTARCYLRGCEWGDANGASRPTHGILSMPFAAEPQSIDATAGAAFPDKARVATLTPRTNLGDDDEFYQP
jgi:hypothetical protein